MHSTKYMHANIREVDISFGAHTKALERERERENLIERYNGNAVLLYEVRLARKEGTYYLQGAGFPLETHEWASRAYARELVATRICAQNDGERRTCRSKSRSSSKHSSIAFSTETIYSSTYPYKY